jgi:predicted nucleic acid-binding protein
MTFDAILNGTELFLDANTLIYHFTNHAKNGAACTRLLERIELQELRGYVSSHVLADVAHRLMTIEAMNRLSWPPAGLAARLKSTTRRSRRLVSTGRRSPKSARSGFKSCR